MADTDLTALIEQLKTQTPKEKTEPTKVDEENLTAFVLEKAAKLIEGGVTTAEELKESIRQGTDPEEIMAYSDIIKATTAAIEAVNKIGLQNKKLKVTSELKKLDIESRKGLQQGTGNTNVLICTREEVIKGLLNEVKTSFEEEAKLEPEVLELEN